MFVYFLEESSGDLLAGEVTIRSDEDSAMVVEYGSGECNLLRFAGVDFANSARVEGHACHDQTRRDGLLPLVFPSFFLSFLLLSCTPDWMLHDLQDDSPKKAPR